MMKFIPLFVAVVLLTACTVPEDPDSHSEQGKTTQEATTKKVADAPQWVGHMDEVHIGMNEAEVKAILGKPTDTDTTEMESFTGSGTTVMDSWTYGSLFSSRDGDDIWMLSFTDGELDSKTRI